MTRYAHHLSSLFSLATPPARASPIIALMDRPKSVYESMRNAKGNVSPEMRNKIAGWYRKGGEKNYFIHDILSRMEMTEMTIFDTPDEPTKKQGRVVFELDIELGEYAALLCCLSSRVYRANRADAVIARNACACHRHVQRV